MGLDLLAQIIPKFLLNRGNKVKVYDNFSSGSRSFFGKFLNHKLLEIIEGKAEDTQKLINTLEGTDILIHLASNPDIAAAVENPTIDFYQGTALTSSVLEAEGFQK